MSYFGPATDNSFETVVKDFCKEYGYLICSPCEAATYVLGCDIYLTKFSLVNDFQARFVVSVGKPKVAECTPSFGKEIREVEMFYIGDFEDVRNSVESGVLFREQQTSESELNQYVKQCFQNQMKCEFKKFRGTIDEYKEYVGCLNED